MVIPSNTDMNGEPAQSLDTPKQAISLVSSSGFHSSKTDRINVQT